MSVLFSHGNRTSSSNRHVLLSNGICEASVDGKMPRAWSWCGYEGERGARLDNGWEL